MNKIQKKISKMSTKERVEAIREYELGLLNAVKLSLKDVINYGCKAGVKELINSSALAPQYQADLLNYNPEIIDSVNRLETINEIITKMNAFLEDVARLQMLAVEENLNCVKYLSKINKGNREFLDKVKADGLTLVSDDMEKSLETWKDLLSVKAMREQKELEDAKVSEVKVEVEEKVEPKKVVLTEEAKERIALANTINAKFADLSEIRKDLPKSRAIKYLTETFCARLDNFSENYRLPVDASRSIKCLRQANHEIDNIYPTTVDPIKEAINLCAMLSLN